MQVIALLRNIGPAKAVYGGDNSVIIPDECGITVQVLRVGFSDQGSWVALPMMPRNYVHCRFGLI